MKFSRVAGAALVPFTGVVAKSVTFINQDPTPRTIHTNGNHGDLLIAIPDEHLPANGMITIRYPDMYPFTIAARAVSPGHRWEENYVQFEATWDPQPKGVSFNAESIDVKGGPNSIPGIHWCHPVGELEPKTKLAGCDTFPCMTAFTYPEDHHPAPDLWNVKHSHVEDFVCYVGGHDGVSYHGFPHTAPVASSGPEQSVASAAEGPFIASSNEEHSVPSSNDAPSVANSNEEHYVASSNEEPSVAPSSEGQSVGSSAEEEHEPTWHVFGGLAHKYHVWY